MYLNRSVQNFSVTTFFECTKIVVDLKKIVIGVIFYDLSHFIIYVASLCV